MHEVSLSNDSVAETHLFFFFFLDITEKLNPTLQNYKLLDVI